MAGDIYSQITTGTVVAVNDSQQYGMLRIAVPAYGDRSDGYVEDLPWAKGSAPFAGTINNDQYVRGPNSSTTEGPVAYGFFNTPALGAQVLVCCLNGDHTQRVWLGCLYPERLVHTLPSGRYIVSSSGTTVDGPYSSLESQIEPLYTNLTQAFGAHNTTSWITRAMDYQASAVNVESKLASVSSKSDSTNGSLKPDGATSSTSIKQGYSAGLMKNAAVTGDDIQNTVYCWTTPGFHSIFMDDRPGACKIKIRTTAGHQLILDDTNGHIYINTNTGSTWFEMDDSTGNVDLYAAGDYSVHTDTDFNFDAAGNINLNAAGDINMKASGNILAKAAGVSVTSEADIGMSASGSVGVTAASNIALKAGATYSVSGATLQIVSSGSLFQQGVDMHMNATGSAYLTAASDMHLNAGSTAMLTSGSTLNLSGSQIQATGGEIHLNGPSATSATAASAATATAPTTATAPIAPTRVPSHEPWSH